MIDLDDIRQDIFDIKTVPKVLYVYRGDTFEVDLDLTISSSELNTVVLNCDGLPEATPLTLLESTTVSSKWHLVLNKTQTLILAPKNHNFTITIVRTDGTELTLYKGVMTVNNRVHSNYSNNYYIATLLKQTAPTISDNNYLIGTMWVNVLTNRVYFLTSVVNNDANWLDSGKFANGSDVDMTGVQDGDVIEKRGELYKPTNRVTQLEATRELLENKAQDFTTINQTKYPTVQAVKTELDKKVDKLLTIIGLDLQDNILIDEFRTALGNATQIFAGLMSPEDKAHLDGLMALFDGDEDSVVNTIAEVLAIFNNYPEGVELVTVLASKVDKVEGKQLSTNDLTNILKNYYDTAYTHSQIKDKSNPHNTSFANITDKPTTRDGFGITDVYTKNEAYSKSEVYNKNEVDKNNLETNHRVTTLEETLRKSFSGEIIKTAFGSDNIPLGKDVAPAPISVKVNGGIVSAEQLVENGDFSDGTTGWFVDTNTVENGELNSNVSSGFLTYQLISTPTTTKYYISFFARKLGTGGLRVEFRNNITLTSNQLVLNETIITSMLFQSGILTTTAVGNNLAITRVVGNNLVISDNYRLFNITTLQTNKQYSPLYNTTFDLMTNEQIKLQMDIWVNLGVLPNDLPQVVSMNKRVRSVGKNLLDPESITVLNATTIIYYKNDLCPIKPITNYTFSISNINRLIDGMYLNWYDIDGQYISQTVKYNAYAVSGVSPSNACYLSVQLYTVAGLPIPIEPQLEQGSTATTYAPYTTNDLYLVSNKLGYQVPNTVADTIEFKNGKYYHIQRVQRYVLQESDVASSVVRANSLEVYTNTLDTFVPLPNITFVNAYQGVAVIHNFTELAYASTNAPFTFSTHSNNRLYINMPLEMTFQDAKDYLVGKELYYQVATPIETEITALGLLTGYQNGTVLIEDIMPDVARYTTNASITNEDYPLKAVKKLIKLNGNIKLDHTQCVIDGNTFTHPELTDNDLIFFDYEYDLDNTFMGGVVVSYYDNDQVLVSPNGTVFRLAPTVDNSGVVTWTTVGV